MPLQLLIQLAMCNLGRDSAAMQAKIALLGLSNVTNIYSTDTAFAGFFTGGVKIGATPMRVVTAPR